MRLELTNFRLRLMVCAVLVAALWLTPLPRTARAQDTVTGAFEGTVTNSQTGEAVTDAAVEIINRATNLTVNKRTNARGIFYQGLLAPGVYLIRVAAPSYQTREVEQRLLIARTGEVVPVPVALDPAPAVTTATAAATPTTTTAPALTVNDTDVRGGTVGGGAERGGSFNEGEVVTLPLGATTLTRTFDEFATLLPGVVLAPQSVGNGTGPGVGAGVGSSGQFSVNGLRSRGNNFTVDGSDNNDEDIGVRRQGFLALVPQPIESIREYQVITLLAPAQFGRNLGAQVNAVSKSGGNATHGTVFGFINSSGLNARNWFDTTNGNGMFAQRIGNQNVIIAPQVNFNDTTLSYVPVGGSQLTTVNGSGGEDSLTLGQFGAAFGGAIKRDKIFYFVSGERQILNAAQEANFAVPTAGQRGAFDSAATGLFRSPANNNPVFAIPNTISGNAIFSLFPYPNNPNGIYGANTFTQTLPASGRGTILSAKLDDQFTWRGRQQTVTGRYNYTDDKRILPVTGGAIFSSLEPRVKTQNFSFFFNSQLSAPDAETQIFNQLRLSYGRTRLRFDEVRDARLLNSSYANQPYLLNAPLVSNFTLPQGRGGLNPTANTGNVILLADNRFNIEQVLGPVGQVIIAGFSPVGTDVYNFPQRRVNNTYQIADQLNLRLNRHTFSFGTDNRRTELNSDLPRNFRPLITFYGAPAVGANAVGQLTFTGNVVRPLDLAAAGAPTGLFQTLTAGDDAGINLRFYQINFFAQDEWRATRNLSFSLGLRYEYNTPFTEAQRRIEGGFMSGMVPLVPGLQPFFGDRDGRAFRPDRNNFAPRFGFAYSPDAARSVVVRGGFGVYYDQTIGAVISQSRTVFPRFLNVNVAGGTGNLLFPFAPFSINNPALNPTLVLPGTLNRLNPNFTLAQQLQQLNLIASAGGVLPGASGIEVTLPAQRLDTPHSYQATLGVEKSLGFNLVASAAYVYTEGRNLLRFTTPNLGSNAVLLVSRFDAPVSGDQRFQPQFFGVAIAPGTNIVNGTFTSGRPNAGVGGISRFETTATSVYQSAQLQLRGRLWRAFQFQTNYTFGRALDDVSDVFDLAGAGALPQNSITFAGERSFASFDARHRFTYNFVYDMPATADNSFVRALAQGLQFAGTGRFQTGQPFTVNSIYDINLDGNLTDRINTLAGLQLTGNRRQPIVVTTTDSRSLLAPIGQDGQIQRNAFRAGNILELDFAATKTIKFDEQRALIFRIDVFNFINRANYGIPVRFLEAPAFGQATDTVTPGRRVQFALKFAF